MEMCCIYLLQSYTFRYSTEFPLKTDPLFEFEWLKVLVKYGNHAKQSIHTVSDVMVHLGNPHLLETAACTRA